MSAIKHSATSAATPSICLALKEGVGSAIPDVGKVPHADVGDIKARMRRRSYLRYDVRGNALGLAMSIYPKLLGIAAVVFGFGLAEALAAGDVWKGSWKYEVDRQDQPALSYYDTRGKRIFGIACVRISR
jgi:hypothetical protein